jgi:hypothetical protein
MRSKTYAILHNGEGEAFGQIRQLRDAEAYQEYYDAHVKNCSAEHHFTMEDTEKLELKFKTKITSAMQGLVDEFNSHDSICINQAMTIATNFGGNFFASLVHFVKSMPHKNFYPKLSTDDIFKTMCAYVMAQLQSNEEK